MDLLRLFLVYGWLVHDWPRVFLWGSVVQSFHGLTLAQSWFFMCQYLWLYILFSATPMSEWRPMWVVWYLISHIVTVNMRTSLSVNISYCRTSACAYQRSLSSHFLISPGVSMRMDAWLGCIRAGCWVFHSLCTWQRVRTVRMIEERCMQSELVDLLLRLYWTGDEVILWTIWICLRLVLRIKEYSRS